MYIKRSVFWLFMGAPMLTFAQQSFSVQVKIKHLEHPGKAYLNYQIGTKLFIDSAILSGETYSFKGVITDPSLAQLSIRDNTVSAKSKMLFYTMVWLEKGAITINSDDPSAKALITGGTLNSDYQKLDASKAPERVKMEVATQRVTDATEEERKSTEFLKKHMQVMKAAMNAAAIKDSLYINTHPNSYLSLYLISNSTTTVPFYKLEQRLKALSKPLQASSPGKELQTTINVLKNREIGGRAPDFTLKNTLDQPVTLSSLHGKFVLLDFWASWCVPCRRENPNVKAAYEHFKDKNFTVLSVSIDAQDAKSKWLAAIKEDHLDWTQLHDAPGGSNQAALLYNVLSIPQNFLIDPSGKIIAKNLRGEELQKRLAELVH